MRKLPKFVEKKGKLLLVIKESKEMTGRMDKTSNAALRHTLQEHDYCVRGPDMVITWQFLNTLQSLFLITHQNYICGLIITCHTYFFKLRQKQLPTCKTNPETINF